MKVAIIQEFVPPYREPFFNQLNDRLGGNLTIFLIKKNYSIECEQRVFQNVDFIGNFIHSQLCLSAFDEFDLVVMMFDLRWSLLYRLLMRRHEKLVLWGHGMGSRKLLARIKTSFIHRSLGFIAYEKHGATFFGERGIPEHKLASMGNTVNVVDFALSTKPRRYFIYMGRLQARKGLNQLIRAFALLPKEMQKQSGLLFLGDGEICAELEEVAESTGVQEHCQFVPGSYDSQLVKGYLDEAIAYVSPGHLGLGVLHAFAYGVPVISRKGAAHAPEVVNVEDGRNGYLTEDSDQAIMMAMQSYLVSPEVHQRHCDAAYRRYAEHRTMEKMTARFAGALDDFLPSDVTKRLTSL